MCINVFLWLRLSQRCRIFHPYFYVSNGSEFEINHSKQGPLGALCKSLTTNKNLQVMKPKWTVKKLENGQIVQVYDELSDFKYFTIPWSHLSATMKDQPCWIFWYSAVRFIQNEVSQVWSFPVWYYVVDDDDKSQMLKWMLWWGGKLFMAGWYLLSMLDWYRPGDYF